MMSIVYDAPQDDQKCIIISSLKTYLGTTTTVILFAVSNNIIVYV